MTFIYRRGQGAMRRVMHIAAYDRMGRETGQSLCGKNGFNTTCNLPLGQPICKKCKEVAK